jgi:hypothetical protein
MLVEIGIDMLSRLFEKYHIIETKCKLRYNYSNKIKIKNMPKENIDELKKYPDILHEITDKFDKELQNLENEQTRLVKEEIRKIKDKKLEEIRASIKS